MNEAWKDIPGYENVYQVSNLGRVRSLDRFKVDRWGKKVPIKGKVLQQELSHKGYFSVVLFGNGSRSRRETHVLVALIFLGERPDKHHVHHIDGNSKNNRVDNLQYIHESKHTSEHNRGEGAHKAKLTEEDIPEIRKLIQAGRTQKDIATLFGVSRQTICEIKRGTIWTHV